MAGYVIEESFCRHPKVLTATEISLRLGITYRSALTLKRRIQVLASEMMPAMKKLIHKELRKEFPDSFRLPDNGSDVSEHVKDKNIVHADTMVLYSARERYGRKRHQNKGLTSSIYRSEKLGGEQIGTLVHVITDGKFVLLDSVPDLTANTCGPIIKDSLPRNTALFTDEGYKWLFRIYPNHRMVNHSLKSEDKRYKFSKQRWKQNGVHNQKAEGMNGSLKANMRGYVYFRPVYSTLYLNEWAFFKNLRHFGVDKVASSLASSNGSALSSASRRRRAGGVIHGSEPGNIAEKVLEAPMSGCGDSEGGIRRPALLRRLLPQQFRLHLRAFE